MNLRKQILTLSAGVSLVAMSYSCQKTEVVEAGQQNALSDTELAQLNPKAGDLILNLKLDIQQPELANSPDELRALGWINQATSGGLLLDKDNFVQDLGAQSDKNEDGGFRRLNQSLKIYVRSKSLSTSTLREGDNQTNPVLREYVGEVGVRSYVMGNQKFVRTADGGWRVNLGGGAKALAPTQGELYGIVLAGGTQGDDSQASAPDGVQNDKNYRPINQQLYFYSGKRNQDYDADVTPNHKVKEVVGTTPDKRFFPYRSTFVRITDITNPKVGTNKTGIDGNPYDSYENADLKVTLKPAGTIFRFQFKNATGKQIVVDSILGDNTNNRVLAYEGYYNLGANALTYTNSDKTQDTFGGNIPNDNLKAGLEPEFQEYYAQGWLSKTQPDGRYTNLKNRFPVYASDGTTAGYTMAANKTISDGVFLVWGYAIRELNDSNDGARFRVKYTVDGVKKTSKVVVVKSNNTSLKGTGKKAFLEGKVYSAVLTIE